jgi:hypothetical protein
VLTDIRKIGSDASSRVAVHWPSDSRAALADDHPGCPPPILVDPWKAPPWHGRWSVQPTMARSALSAGVFPLAWKDRHWNLPPGRSASLAIRDAHIESVLFFLESDASDRTIKERQGAQRCSILTSNALIKYLP